MPASGANPIKLLQVNITCEFYEFSKTNPTEYIFAIFFPEFTYKIQVKCCQKISLAGFTHKILRISTSKCFIGLASGQTSHLKRLISPSVLRNNK